MWIIQRRAKVLAGCEGRGSKTVKGVYLVEMSGVWEIEGVGWLEGCGLGG